MRHYHQHRYFLRPTLSQRWSFWLDRNLDRVVLAVVVASVLSLGTHAWLMFNL